MQIKLASYSAIGSRTVNEDACACEQIGPELFCAVVCDGLGSHGGGQDASAIVVNQLKQTPPTHLPTAQQIAQWLERSNQEILRRRKDPLHMKTTAVALFVEGRRAIWVHIGDSRLYHYHNGRLVDATEDHSVCNLAVKMGNITRRDIPKHPDRNKVLKVLGEESISPEIHEDVELPPGRHAFLLCSDGLWERLHEDEIMLDLQKSQTPEQWLQELRSRAQMRKYTDVDNNTAAAVWLDI